MVHKDRPVLVWVNVDIEVSAAVAYLNTLPDVRTFASCRGTIGEGGENPHKAYVMAWWPESNTQVCDAITQYFDIGEVSRDETDGLLSFGYLHPHAALTTQLPAECVAVARELIEWAVNESAIYHYHGFNETWECAHCKQIAFWKEEIQHTDTCPWARLKRALEREGGES